MISFSFFDFCILQIMFLMVVFFCLVIHRKHFLMVLLFFEFIMLCLFFSFFLFSSSSDVYVSMVFLCFSVCEASVGLSLLVSFIRSHGVDFVSVVSSYECY